MDPALGIIIVVPKVIPVEAQINLSMLEATRETSGYVDVMILLYVYVFT